MIDSSPASPAATDPAALSAVWRWLGVSLDLLVVVLLAFTILRGDLPPIAWAWVAAFAVAYAARRLRPESEAPGWLGAIAICFGGVALTAPDGVYLAFPLFFLIMHLARGWTALLMVASTAAMAIVAIGVHRGWSAGGIVGPLLGAVVAIIVGTGFRMLMREATTRADAIDALLAARADVAEISRRAGELDERARLAADIHDTVAQGLSSIQLLLHSAEHSALRGRYGDSGHGGGGEDGHSGRGGDRDGSSDADATLDAIRMARGVAADNLEETRRIIAALQPGALAGADLPVALARVCAVAPATVDDSPTTFVVDGVARPLPAEVEATFVRIAQASIANVARHAAASRCAVTLTYQDDCVSLDVVDDGVGFDPGAPVPPGAVGIDGVRRRMAALGGTVSIESAPGRGCGVSVRVVLDDGKAPS